MHHTVVHFEIPADNPERATKFYRELFGWDIQKWSADGGGSGGTEYWSVSTAPTNGSVEAARAGINGGVTRRQKAGQPPVNYIGVASVDEHVRKAKALGAWEVTPKTPVKGMGWFALLRDTEGNTFGLWELDAQAA